MRVTFTIDMLPSSRKPLTIWRTIVMTVGTNSPTGTLDSRTPSRPNLIPTIVEETMNIKPEETETVVQRIIR
jgi:hypothetical protein